MNTPKILDALCDEKRKLARRIELADAREEKLAQSARDREEELSELFTDTANDPHLDRLLDLANRASQRHHDLKWRHQEVSHAADLLEEIADSTTRIRDRNAMRRRQQAQKAV